MNESTINERARCLLKALIERYIRDGQPVGSKTLLEESGLDISPATVRNVVADLERLGLVHSPHTSAGRVPTEQGYRLFIDNLVSVKPLTSPEVRNIADQLEGDEDMDALVESASSMLSSLSRMAGVVMLPYQQQTSLRRIEFLPLTEGRVLAVLVLGDYDVQNRIIHTTRPYGRSELERIANYLNAQFKGRSLSVVRHELLSAMQGAREDIDRLMREAVSMAEQVFEADSQPDQDYILAGETNLMNYEEMADVARLRQLFEAFNEKRTILDLLDKSLQARGVQIFIGQESGYQALDSCSVVTATYGADDDVLGVLGVIGPTRMAYDRVIPLVDVTAKLLGSVLKQRH